MPPTRLVRYCCSEFKESGGKGQFKVTGVRWSESLNRKNNADVLRFYDTKKSTIALAERLGLDYRINKSGGLIMSVSSGDNDALRSANDFVHQCYKDCSTTLNPIIEWSDSDVWDFLHYYGCRSNPLYECGMKRIGCIGCPLVGAKSMKKDFLRYPKYKAAYLHAFEKMLSVRLDRGKNNGSWLTGYDVLQWWLGENPDQYTMFSDDELYSILEYI